MLWSAAVAERLERLVVRKRRNAPTHRQMKDDEEECILIRKCVRRMRRQRYAASLTDSYRVSDGDTMTVIALKSSR